MLERFPSSSVSFEAPPFYVTAPPGDCERVFVVEGAGRIRLVKEGGFEPVQFPDIQEDVRFDCSECGLFSAAFAPDYETSGRFYVQYTRLADEPEGHHELVTEEFSHSDSNPGVAAPDDLLLETGSITPTMAFGVARTEAGPDAVCWRGLTPRASVGLEGRAQRGPLPGPQPTAGATALP